MPCFFARSFAVYRKRIGPSLPVVALRCRGQAVNILRRNGTQHGSIRIRARMVALVHEHHAVALHEFFQSFAFSQRRDHRNVKNSGQGVLTAL